MMRKKSKSAKTNRKGHSSRRLMRIQEEEPENVINEDNEYVGEDYERFMDDHPEIVDSDSEGFFEV